MLKTVKSGIIYWLKMKGLQMHASPLIPVSLPAVIGGVPCWEQCQILINKQEANNVKCTGTIVYITLLFISRTQIIWFTVGIWNPKNGNIRAIPMVPTIQKPDNSKSDIFVWILNIFLPLFALFSLIMIPFLVILKIFWKKTRICSTGCKPVLFTIWNPD